MDNENGAAYSEDVFNAAIAAARALVIAYWTIGKAVKNSNSTVDVYLWKDLNTAIYSLPVSVRVAAVSSFSTDELKAYGRI